MATADNNRFLRFWSEVSIEKVGFSYSSSEQAEMSKMKWFPYNKGGDIRKWYGNNEYVVNWENDGFEIKNFKDKTGKLKSRPQNTQFYFRKGITWSFVSSRNFGVRIFPDGFLFDVGGSSVFPKEQDIFYLTALLCSKLTMEFLKIQNPTLNFQVGNVSNIPVIRTDNLDLFNKINDLCQKCISISKDDWDALETSWDFKRHPLLKDKSQIDSIKKAYSIWDSYKQESFSKLQTYEEELNSMFIDIYGLKNELTPDVQYNNITILKADRVRDVKSFISYAVGCMFGRYSLDEDGLVYAGGDLNRDRYRTFKPIEDNILPIADDVYFEDDIMSRFIDFVRITFGEKTLEENLDYIAGTLNKKPNETSRQTIRRYFLNDFYKDHVQTYKKRPIYWLFDSGKQNGFKALIYMHRYDPYTVARVRTDYLHKLQKKYDAENNRLDIVLESNVSQAEKAKARKKKEDLNKKIQECTVYDQAIAHVANQKIEIDLDDGVAVNYSKFQGIEIPEDEGKKPIKADLLAKI